MRGERAEVRRDGTDVGSRRSGRCAWMLLLAAALWTWAAPAPAQEVVPVQVADQPVFSVVAADTVTAAARAQRIMRRLSERIASPAPLAPIRVEPVDSAAALLVGGDTLLVVTARDAEVQLGRAIPAAQVPEATRAVAREWAESLARVFGAVAARETAPVVVLGNPAFSVAGTSEVRAVVRADAIADRLARLAASDEAVEFEAVERGGLAAVRFDSQLLAEVLPVDTAAFDLPALQLARQWAVQAETVVGEIRFQASPQYLVWVFFRALAALAAAAGLHWVLRRRRRRRGDEAVALEAGRWGLGPVVARWALGVVQFLVWAALTVYLLWLFPRTRPLTYQAGERASDQLGDILAWIASEGLVVLLILVATVFVARFVGAVVQHLITGFGVRQGGRLALRASTLAGTAAAVVEVIVFLLGVLTVLAQMEIDLVPLLAGAGVAGIAIGFGVQSLIRDFFTGFFILLEDQYGVGDVIRLGDITGKVERFTLRITQVRSLDGSLTSVPNGEILRVTNLSKDWAQVVLDINIALGENVDRATEVIAATAGALAAAWEDRILDAPEILGVDAVDPMARAVTIRMVVKTAPLERWSVMREMRRRILQAFEEADIEVPPRSVVTLPGGGPGDAQVAGGPGASGF